MSERYRFICVGANSAPASALASAHFFRDESVEWRSQLLEEDPKAAEADWEGVAGFPEVPWELLHGTQRLPGTLREVLVVRAGLLARTKSVVGYFQRCGLTSSVAG